MSLDTPRGVYDIYVPREEDEGEEEEDGRDAVVDERPVRVAVLSPRPTRSLPRKKTPRSPLPAKDGGSAVIK